MAFFLQQFGNQRVKFKISVPCSPFNHTLKVSEVRRNLKLIISYTMRPWLNEACLKTFLLHVPFLDEDETDSLIKIIFMEIALLMWNAYDMK